MNNTIYKYKFEPAFPISPELYLNSRFQLKGLTTFEIQLSLNGEHKYNFEEGLEVLRQHEEKKNQMISMYNFKVTDDNTLIESFYMEGLVHFQISTKVEDIAPFFNYIFPLFGVLLYGEFDSNEHFLSRDDVCCKFGHEIYPKHTEFSATWWDDNPFINHFFVFPKKEWENKNVKNIVAIGGEPLEFGYDNIQNTSANFYLMKQIPRHGTKAYIQSTDDLKNIEVYEKEIIQSTINGLKREGVNFQTYYSVI
ncbi:hypothetical protein [Virgibacillus halodenitrificans]|uniref:hypothetical protein n=1 Tax=Virgibacillus halodenitrificans TaxID=1482 RepID=UPI000EF48D5A|nr:hypothetical protein [Virgibacillus halodenitrificans]